MPGARRSSGGRRTRSRLKIDRSAPSSSRISAQGARASSVSRPATIVLDGRIELEQAGSADRKSRRSGIHDQVKADGDEILIERDIRSAPGDGIEIGEIERAKAESVIAAGAGQFERVGRCVQDASHRLIMGAAAGDGVDGAAALEIEHGDDLEGIVRHGIRV